MSFTSIKLIYKIKNHHTNKPQKAEQYGNYAFILERLRHVKRLAQDRTATEGRSRE